MDQHKDKNENRFNNIFGSQANFMNSDFTPSQNNTSPLETSKKSPPTNPGLSNQNPEPNDSQSRTNLSTDSDRTLTHPTLQRKTNLQQSREHTTGNTTPNTKTPKEDKNVQNPNVNRDISNSEVQNFLKREINKLFEAEKKNLTYNITPPPNMLQRNIKEALQPQNLNNNIANVYSPLRTNNNSDENTVDTTQGTDNIDISGLTLLNQAFANNLTNKVNNNTHDTNRLLMPSTTNKSSPTLQTAINNNNKKAKDTYQQKKPSTIPIERSLSIAATTYKK